MYLARQVAVCFLTPHSAYGIYLSAVCIESVEVVRHRTFGLHALRHVCAFAVGVKSVVSQFAVGGLCPPEFGLCVLHVGAVFAQRGESVLAHPVALVEQIVGELAAQASALLRFGV